MRTRERERLGAALAPAARVLRCSRHQARARMPPEEGWMPEIVHSACAGHLMPSLRRDLMPIPQQLLRYPLYERPHL